MKIVCENCGAKYSIADEKVAGKVFKIRCKKCSEVIVVRGDQGDDESTRVLDGSQAAPPVGGEAVWHIVVSGDQQGPFTPAQISDMLSAGTVDWEAYVWREGFDNWLPARDVEPLVQAITGGGDAGGGAAAGAAGDFGADPFGGAAGGADPFGGGAFGAESIPAPAPEKAPAARAPRAGGSDLFGQSEASPFGGGGDDDDGVVASAPSPRVSSQQAALTGQRNENSVLFSLANLQALATGTPSSSGSTAAPSSSAQPRAGMASGEGSGLIDIRALAGGLGGGASASMGATPAKKDAVDDLLSIGSGGSPFAPTLGAPMLAPVKQESSNKGLIIGVSVGVAAVVAAAAVVLVVMLGNKKDDAAEAGGTLAPSRRRRRPPSRRPRPRLRSHPQRRRRPSPPQSLHRSRPTRWPQRPLPRTTSATARVAAGRDARAAAERPPRRRARRPHRAHLRAAEAVAAGAAAHRPRGEPAAAAAAAASTTSSGRRSAAVARQRVRRQTAAAGAEAATPRSRSSRAAIRCVQRSRRFRRRSRHVAAASTASR